MRLTPAQVNSIKQVAAEVLGEHARLTPSSTQARVPFMQHIAAGAHATFGVSVMTNKVVQVSPLADGWLHVVLHDGRQGEFDVKPFMIRATAGAGA